jgi:hypothetical protein
MQVVGLPARLVDLPVRRVSGAATREGRRLKAGSRPGVAPTPSPRGSQFAGAGHVGTYRERRRGAGRAPQADDDPVIASSNGPGLTTSLVIGGTMASRTIDRSLCVVIDRSCLRLRHSRGRWLVESGRHPWSPVVNFDA